MTDDDDPPMTGSDTSEAVGLVVLGWIGVMLIWWFCRAWGPQLIALGLRIGGLKFGSAV